MNPLNSPLEVGMRVLVLLSETFPEPLDVSTLVWLDYAMLHSGEFDGPTSLHPQLPAGPGELAMKRELIEQGLVVLMRAGLAGVEATVDGLSYRATEEGPPFVEVLEAPYVRELRQRAAWVVATCGTSGAQTRQATQQIASRWLSEASVHNLFGGGHD